MRNVGLGTNHTRHPSNKKDTFSDLMYNTTTPQIKNDLTQLLVKVWFFVNVRRTFGITFTEALCLSLGMRLWFG